MLRALSTRNGRAYEKLEENQYYHDHQSGGPLLDPKMMRAKTVPAAAAKIIFSDSPSGKDLELASTVQQSREEKTVEKKAKKVSKVHPIFNLFNPRLRKKATAKPEFSRYVNYLKEGGILPSH